MTERLQIPGEEMETVNRTVLITPLSMERMHIKHSHTIIKKDYACYDPLTNRFRECGDVSKNNSLKYLDLAVKLSLIHI